MLQGGAGDRDGDRGQTASGDSAMPPRKAHVLKTKRNTGNMEGGREQGAGDRTPSGWEIGTRLSRTAQYRKKHNTRADRE